MRSTTHRAEIEAVLEQLARAHADHDADAIADSYAPDAVIYDLAPPLGRRGMNRDSIAAWLTGWEGPIQIDSRDVHLAIEGNLAFVSALNRMRGSQKRCRPGYVVSHDSVPSQGGRAMANRL